jgi:hypothetical protein
VGSRKWGAADARVLAGLRQPSPANVLAALLFLSLVLRLVFVCSASPIIGYANNLDFFRQSACVGVWASYAVQDRISAHVDSPIDDLVHDGVQISAYCMASSDNVFVWVAARFHPVPAHFNLREVGLLKGLLTLALTVLVFLQPIGASARLASAFLAALVFGDIAVECYFNTLYVDASAIMAASFALLGTVSLCARAKPLGWASFALIAGPVLWLGTVKPQYEILALLQGLIDAFILLGLWRDLPKACVIAVVAAAGPLVFNSLNSDPQSIMRYATKVNQADSILQAVLPAARDKAGALKTLGLPPSCAPAIGRNGYDEDVRAGRLCPELSEVSRLRLPLLFAEQPRTFFVPFSHGLDFSRPSLLELFHPFAQTASPVLPLLKETSLSTQLNRLGKVEYRFLLIFIVLFWPLKKVCSFLKKRTKRLLCPGAATAALSNCPAAVQAQRQ